jgi:hypothetical protein
MSGLDFGLIGWAPHFLRLASNLQDWGVTVLGLGSTFRSHASLVRHLTARHPARQRHDFEAWSLVFKICVLFKFEAWFSKSVT